MVQSLHDLVQKCRSYRRFNEKRLIVREELTSLVALARLAPSARNGQPLRFILSCEQTMNERIFPLLAWAGYLKEWDGPEPGERPAAYIVVVSREQTLGGHLLFDAGLAVQSILLGAVEKGLGGCIIGAYSKEKLKDAIQIPAGYEPLYVIALGEPSEEVMIESLKDGDIKYWRDENSVHHVPKRDVSELILY